MRSASAFLLTGALLADAAGGTDLTAVLSQVEGNVTIKEKIPPGASRSPIRQARFLQTIRPGDEILVPAGAGARLVCSNDREISLPKAKEIRFTKDLCIQGTPTSLPPGTYRK